jgi:hypothetical protein
MTEYQDGEYVRIVIDTARVQKEDAGWLECLLGAYRCVVPLDGPGVTVERVAPAEWPPQPGDLWHDRTQTSWFAADVADIGETDLPDIVLVSEDNHRLVPDEVNQRYGPMTLEHRKGEMAATDA